MKKLTALAVVLLGLTLLPSCQGMDAEDLEPIAIEVVEVEDQQSEGDDDPSGHGSGKG